MPRAHFQDGRRPRVLDELPQTGDPSKPAGKIEGMLGNVDPAKKEFGDALRRVIRDQAATLEELMARLDRVEQALVVLAAEEEGEEEEGSEEEGLELPGGVAVGTDVRKLTGDRQAVRRTSDGAGSLIAEINQHNRKHYKVN